MEEQSISINFNSVSNFTGITKAWLYKQPYVKDLIQKLKVTKNNVLMRDQAIQLKHKNKEIDILTKQNKQLRSQIDELKQQLEVAYAAIYKQDD
jgi:cell shape-determining protein MreC